MSKKLVAYFSASGTTKKAAEHLAKTAGADLFEIKPAVPYSRADLDWTNKKSRSSIEMQNPDSRPAISEQLSNIEDYDVAPTIIDTFLESYDFSGKTIIPFATSGGSGMGKTVEVLQALCPTANWKDSKMLNHISNTELQNWLRDLSIL